MATLYHDRVANDPMSGFNLLYISCFVPCTLEGNVSFLRISRNEILIFGDETLCY